MLLKKKKIHVTALKCKNTLCDSVIIVIIIIIIIVIIIIIYMKCNSASDKYNTAT